MRDALVRLGGIADPPLEPAMPAESHFHYRNKLEYSFAPRPSGAVLGFHRAGRWDEVLDIRECWLTTELGNGLRDAVRRWAREHELPAYDQRSQDGFLRHLVVREGRNTGQALVVLVTAPGSLPEESFVRAVTRFPEVRSVSWGINDRPAEVTNVPTRLLWGEDAIEEELCGLRFRVRPERLSPDEHRDGRARLRPRRGVRRASRARRPSMTSTAARARSASSSRGRRSPCGASRRRRSRWRARSRTPS